MSLKIQTNTGDEGSSSKPYAYFQVGSSAAAGTYFAYGYGNNIKTFTTGYVGISGSSQLSRLLEII